MGINFSFWSSNSILKLATPWLGLSIFSICSAKHGPNISLSSSLSCAGCLLSHIYAISFSTLFSKRPLRSPGVGPNAAFRCAPVKIVSDYPYLRLYRFLLWKGKKELLMRSGIWKVSWGIILHSWVKHVTFWIHFAICRSWLVAGAWLCRLCAQSVVLHALDTSRCFVVCPYVCSSSLPCEKKDLNSLAWIVELLQAAGATLLD